MTEPRILVIGEALIDIVDGTEIVGGSPANVALGLGRLGCDVRLLTALAHDTRGDRIAQHLASSGVGVLPGSFTLERTSTARATLGPDGSAEYDFDVAWTLPATTDDTCDVLHVGSLACFLEPGATALRAIVREAAAAGTRVTFDPNIRADLLAGVDVVARVEEIAASAVTIKLSDADAESIYPGRTLDDVADLLLALGPQLVAVTRGAEGSLIRTARHRVTVEAPRTEVVDTVGAGDTFMAALIASLAAEDEPGSLSAERLGRLGAFCAAAAALTVSRAGADLPTRAEVEAVLGDPA